jgi:hypothetical protein
MGERKEPKTHAHPVAGCGVEVRVVPRDEDVTCQACLELINDPKARIDLLLRKNKEGR